MEEVKNELEELRSFKQKFEQAEAEKVQEQKLLELKQRLTQRPQDSQKAPTAASKVAAEPHDCGKDQPLSKVQQNPVSSLLGVASDETGFSSWDKAAQAVNDMDGRDLSEVLGREGLAAPKANNERQRALRDHLLAQLGMDY